jgi:hypothetical protein
VDYSNLLYSILFPVLSLAGLTAAHLWYRRRGQQVHFLAPKVLVPTLVLAAFGSGLATGSPQAVNGAILVLLTLFLIGVPAGIGWLLFRWRRSG